MVLQKTIQVLTLCCCLTSAAFSQLTGSKSIPGDYSTISSAIVALNSSGTGTGGVIFNIAAGYTETITATLSLTATGTISNPIIFQKDPATSGANPLITAYTGGTGTPSSALQDGIWRFLGVDYVTVDGIDLRDNPSNTTNPSSMEYGYGLYKTSAVNGCQFITIKNCKITLNKINNATGTAPMTDGSAGIIIMNALFTAANAAITPTTTDGTNSNNKIYGNQIQNCNIGIAVIGYNAPSPYTLGDTGNDIGGSSSATGNTIINYGGASGASNPATAITTLAQYGINISFNSINSNNGSGTNHPNVLRGIYLNAASGASAVITNNTITLKAGGTTQPVTGIENAAGSTAAGNSITIDNNTITNSTYASATTGGFYGINNSASPAALIVTSNTVSNNSSAGTGAAVFNGIYNTGTASSITINSNVISGNSTAALTSGLFAGIYNAATASVLNVNSNTIAGNSTSSLSGLHFPIYNTGGVTQTININSNNIGTAVSPAISFTAANSGAQIFINNTGGAATAALSISNNNFQGITYAVQGSGSNTYISNTAYTLSQAINNNTFTSLSVNVTGNITFISNNVVVPSTGTQNVNGNSIVSSFNKTGDGGKITLYTSTATCISGSTSTHNNNNFSNITVIGATNIDGWVNTDESNSAKTVQNNTFSNWVTGTGTVYAINIGINGSANAISGNNINNISGAGVLTGIISASGNDNIYSNNIHSISSTGAAMVSGISVTAGTTKNIYKNKIYDLQASNAAGTVSGIFISGASIATANIYNNLIGDLRTPAANSTSDVIRGINITATALNSNINVYYNTLYINASSTGTNFSTSGIFHTVSASATTAVLNLRNNSITNTSVPKGSGVTVAYRRSGTALNNYASSSNNNLFYAGSPGTSNLIFYDGTNADQLIITYKARVASRDAQSVTEDLATSKFLSTSGSSALYLHMDPSKSSQAESGSVNINGFTSDTDGDIRQGNPGYSLTGTAPDIGADEYEGIKPSALSGTYNVGTGQTFTSLTNAGGFFATVNSLGLSGNLVINVTSDLTEDGSNALYQWAEQGSGSYTITIQPDAAVMRTISGNVLNGLIRLNGAKRIIFNGSGGTSSNYLTIRNTNAAGTTGTALTLINGATNNTVDHCNLEAYANATNGVILFSTSTTTDGNSNNTISNCNVNATTSSNSSNTGIYSGGTSGSENSANNIIGNKIYNYRDRGVDIAASGSKTWNISNNSFYNGDVSGAISFAASTTLHGIRVLGGSGYTISKNYIGGNAALASGTIASYTSTGILSLHGILLTTTSATPASVVSGNTIANMALSVVPTSGTPANVFIGIETNGSGINIGGTSSGDGNMIGSNTVNSSITITTTTTSTSFSSIIRGINCASTGGFVIGNQVGGIDIKNVGTGPAPSVFSGLYISNATPPLQIQNNIIGSTGAVANSVSVLSTSTSTTTVLNGIFVAGSVASAIQVNANTIQNISFQNSVATQNITCISNSANVGPVSITNNLITGNTITTSTAGFYGIYNTGNPAVLNINGNTISSNSSTANSSSFFHGIYVTGNPVAITVNNNIFSGNTTSVFTNGRFSGVNNQVAATTLSINNNSFFNNIITGATGTFSAIVNSGNVTTAININGNAIGTSTAPAVTYSIANSATQNFINNSNGTTAAALSISNNNFQGITYTATGSGTNNFIVNSAPTLSQAINSNTFTNLNINTTGNVTFITNNVSLSSTGIQNVNNNSIITGFTKKDGNNITLFSTSAASASGSIINNNNNNFSNITALTNTTISGWVNLDAGTAIKTIQNNTFSTWTGGTGSITVMSVSSSGTNANTTGNLINNISSASAITGITTSAGTDNIFLNVINTLYTTGGATVIGISINNGTTKNVYRNKIYDLQATNSGGVINGISVSGSSVVTVNLYNNLIGDLRTPISSVIDAIRGISLTSTTTNSTTNVYYNTIYLNASSTGGTFGTSGIYHTASSTATTAALNLRNNIISNLSTPNGSGLTVAYRRSGTALNNYVSTSDNNLFYAGTPGSSRLLFYDFTNADQTIASYKSRVSTRDAASVTEDLSSKLLSTTGSSAVFLHINSSVATSVESGAVNITGFTDDFDGQIRAGNTGYTGTSPSPDIGADEIFGTETVPPTISYTLLTNTNATTNRSVTAITITDASGINVTSGTKPRIYYKRYSDANTWVDNTSSTNGWKFTEATNSSSPFTFTIDYSLLFNGAAVTAGVIQYFIVAQDMATTANVAINSGTFATVPASVALTSAAFPLTGTINSYAISFSGSYNVGSSETFTSLTNANGIFAALNSSSLSGNVTLNITSDLSEDGTNALNQWAESGIGNYTLTIQPDVAVLRTISGNVTAGLIRLNGSSRVSIDGRSGGSGNYLTFRNTNTSVATGAALTFINGASNNNIKYISLEASANAANGVILFGTSTVSGGNSNNLIDNCMINASVSTSIGNTAIYANGTPGNDNSSNTISNNNIFGYKDRGLDISATGNTAWIISNNSLYNGNVTGTINYPAATELHGIRVLGGAGYTILNNTIGGSAAGASGVNASYSSTLGNISYQGILLTTTNATPASNIKGNVIASIYVSSVQTAANSAVFTGIETNGSGINIGGTTAGEGNTIGSNINNGSITAVTSTASIANTSFIRGINCLSSSGVVTGNQISGIDISNTGSAPAPATFTGLFINNSTAPTQVNSNIIGSTGLNAISNSIRVLQASAAIGTSLNGITIGTLASSTIQINGNTIQNISNLSSTSSGNFTGINNMANSTGAIMTITNNAIKNISAAVNADNSTSIYSAIYSASPSTISNNTIDQLTVNATGTAVQLRGIHVTGAYSYSISGNVISNLSTSSASASNIETSSPSGFNITGILNSASVSGQVISGNTLYNFNETTSAAIGTAVTGIAIATSSSSGNIFNNRISAFTNTASGTATYPGISGITSANGSFNVYNNVIKLNNSSYTNAVKIYGILSGATGNWNYFHNTVSISGSGTGTVRSAAFIRIGSGTILLKNNVFINTRTGTGTNFAVSNIVSPAALNWVSGNSNQNDLYSTNINTTGEWGNGLNQNFAQWQISSSGDAASVSHPVTFITSNYDLQPDSTTNCSINNTGIPVTTPVVINTDINGKTRSASNPDMGAYEFNYNTFVITASNNSPVCAGGTINLSVNIGNASMPTFSWRSPANTIVSTSQNFTVTPVPGWYKITVTDINGCIATDSTLVSLYTRPTATLTGGMSICQGNTVSLHLNVTGTGVISGTLSSGDYFSGNAPLIIVAVTPAITTFYSINSLSDLNCSALPETLTDTVPVVVTQTGGWLGTNGSDWNDPFNWCGGIPVATTNVIIPTGSAIYPIVNAGTNVSNNITIQSGASLTVTGSLKIGGTILNSGTFNVNNGGIEMNGTTAQTLPASVFSGNLIKNLTINNNAGVTLGGTLGLTNILLISNGQLNSGGYLTLLSTTGQTALIDGSGAGSVSGNVTMQRYLTAGFGYKYFSSPFQAATVSNFSSTVDLNAAFPNFYSYIENKATTGFTAYTSPGNPLVPLQGYAADFGSSTSPKTVSITGTVNNGNLSVTLYNNNQPYTQGFNLVGNPYPSPIDWNSAGGWTKTNIDNAIYYFDSSTTSQYTGAYSTYINGISSDGIASNVIASMQGFFVHVSNGTYPVTATLGINNNARVNNLNPVFHKAALSKLSAYAPPPILMRLSANFSDNTAAADPLVIYTNEMATNRFDKEFDAIKLMNINERLPNLYALGQEVTKLVINALPVIDSLTIIPLGLQTSKDGTVVFNLRNIEQWPSDLRLFLTDLETGTNQNLRENPVYSISLKKGTYENRFSLRCTPINMQGLDKNNGDIYTVHGSGGILYLKIKLVQEQKGLLTISNIQGQLISSRTISGNGDYELAGLAPNVIYILSFRTPYGTHTQKILLKEK